jgi:hypothetical protein
MDANTDIASGVTAGRRGNARARLNIRARIILLDGQCGCTVDNLSRKDARIEAEWPVKVGDHGILQREGLDEFFTVHWVRDGRCGISFEVEIPEERVLALRRIADNYENHREEGLRAIGREFVEGRAGHSTSG